MGCFLHLSIRALEEIVDKPGKPSLAGRVIRWAGLLISTGLFIGLLARQDLGEIGRSLSVFPLWIVPILLGLYFTGMFFNAVRWYILLLAQGQSIPFARILKIVFAGAFVSNFLPSTIGGDTMRVVGVQKWVNNWVISTSSIVVDRLLNVLAMVVSSPFSLITFGPGLLQLFQSRGSGPVSLAAGWLSDRIPGLSWLHRRFWLPLIDALRLWWNKPLHLALAFIVSWISIFVVFLAVWWIARILGIQVSLAQVIGINVVTYLLTLAPFSFNGYGVREFAMATLYTQLGASLEQASTLALVTRFFMLIETLPGVLWLSQVFPRPFSPKKGEDQQEIA